MTAAHDPAFRADLPRRWDAVRALMAQEEVNALVAVATGAPSQTGWLRYLTGADLWQGRAFVVINRMDEEPLVIVDSEAQLAEIEAAGAGRAEKAGGARSALGRLVEILRDLAGVDGRIGIVSHNAHLPMPADRHLRSELAGVELVDLTAEANRIRQVKSPFELRVISEMGSLLEEGLRRFAETARPGELAGSVAGEIEGFLRGHGCVWGVSKYSFGDRPYLYPAAQDRRFAADDVLVYEFVYASPMGYWYILSSLYSFRPLSANTERLLRATEAAIRETARAAVPGAPCRILKTTPDRVFIEHGLSVIGKHTVDCHPIGTDINDGPGDAPDGWTLRENMVLAIHPATLVEGDLGFFLCNLFVVRDGGAVALTPRVSFYERLSAS
jgi:Xaa-Pro aminopeptidase